MHWYTDPNTIIPLALGTALLYWLARKVDMWRDEGIL